MLEDYYDRDVRKWIRCPVCQEAIKRFTPHFLCYRCGHIDRKEFIYYEINKETLEKQYRDTIRKMLKILLPSEIPVLSVEFPETANLPGWKFICAGWTNGIDNKIFLPRKLLYLPNDEITDTAAHEAAHITTWDELSPPGWDPEHGPQWLDTYYQYRQRLFEEFSDFVNSENPQAKFTKGYQKKTQKDYYNPDY